MPDPNQHPSLARNLALVGGPVVALLVLLFVDLDPANPLVTRTAAVALLMAIWWMGEALPLAVTALLPMVLFPALGILDGRTVAPLYFNRVIFLFIGGFLVALAMQRWNLHRRIALRVLLLFGTRPLALLLGFMIATAFLSMWISNTATTMMMVPIALAVVLELEGGNRNRETGRSAAGGIATAMLLGVAYAATLGGIATLVGTPPNLSFARIFEIYFPTAPEISFARWMLYALPLSAIFLVLTWALLAALFVRRRTGRLDPNSLIRQYRELGPISFEERVVLADFVLLAVAWLTRADLRLGSVTIPGWSRLLPVPEFIDDGTVAVAAALVLFLVPSRRARGGRVLGWQTASGIPWNIVLLFGGGFALASGFKESGLSLWAGGQLAAVSGLHPLLVILMVALLATFLTELTSNTATAEMLLPILAGLAVTIRINPLLLMIPGTLACSLAFMLPVATPPNAIIFGTGRLRIGQMARAGIALNLVGAVLVTLATWLLARAVFDIDLTVFPEWAANNF